MVCVELEGDAGMEMWALAGVEQLGVEWSIEMGVSPWGYGGNPER